MIKKQISILLVGVFLWTQVSPPGAYSGLAWAAPPVERLAAFEDLVPKELGQLRKVHFPLPLDQEVYRQEGLKAALTRITSGDSPMVVLIEDAHSSVEAQMNIANLIEFIRTNYRISLLALEGAAGDAPLTEINTSSVNEGKEEVLDFYLRQALLSGPEYEALRSPESYKVRGVENMEVYESDRKIYLDVAEKRYEIDQALNTAEIRVDKEKEKYYSPAFLTFDKKERHFSRNPSRYLSSFVPYLVREAGRAGLRPRETSSLSLVVRVLADSQNISLENLKKEAAQFRLSEKKFGREIQMLEKRFLPKGSDFDFTVTGPPPRIPHFFLYRFPSLRAYLDLAEMRYQMDPVQMFGEIADFTLKTKELLGKSPKELELDRRGRDLEMLRRILHLEARREDVVAARGARELAKELGLSDLYERAGLFYELAVKRDEILALNTLQAISEVASSPKAAILVAGGFHAMGIQKVLENSKVNYLVITPQFDSNLSNNKLYQMRLKDDLSLVGSSIASPRRIMDRTFLEEIENSTRNLGRGMSLKKAVGEARKKRRENIARIATARILRLTKKTEVAGKTRQGAVSSTGVPMTPVRPAAVDRLSGQSLGKTPTEGKRISQGYIKDTVLLESFADATALDGFLRKRYDEILSRGAGPGRGLIYSPNDPEEVSYKMTGSSKLLFWIPQRAFTGMVDITKPLQVIPSFDPSRRYFRDFPPEQGIAHLSINGRLYEVTTNQRPFLRYHVLINRYSPTLEAIKQHPQVITREALADMLALSRKTRLVLGFNSWEGGATVNQLHFQGFYEGEASFYGSLPIRSDDAEPLGRVNGVSLLRLDKQDSRAAYIFQSPDTEKLAGMVSSFLEVVKRRNIPHNIVILDREIYVFLRSDSPAAFVRSRQPLFGFFEMLGLISIQTTKDFDRLWNGSSQTLNEHLRSVRLSQEDSVKVFREFLEEEREKSAPVSGASLGTEVIIEGKIARELHEPLTDYFLNDKKFKQFARVEVIRKEGASALIRFTPEKGQVREITISRISGKTSFASVREEIEAAFRTPVQDFVHRYRFLLGACALLGAGALLYGIFSGPWSASPKGKKASLRDPEAPKAYVRPSPQPVHIFYGPHRNDVKASSLGNTDHDRILEQNILDLYQHGPLEGRDELIQKLKRKVIRTSEFVDKLASEFDLNYETRQTLKIAALAGDLGKGFSDEKLKLHYSTLKKSEMTPSQQKEIEEFVEDGFQILRQSNIEIPEVSQLLIRAVYQKNEEAKKILERAGLSQAVQILKIASQFSALISAIPYAKDVQLKTNRDIDRWLKELEGRGEISAEARKKAAPVFRSIIATFKESTVNPSYVGSFLAPGISKPLLHDEIIRLAEFRDLSLSAIAPLLEAPEMAHEDLRKRLDRWSEITDSTKEAILSKFSVGFFEDMQAAYEKEDQEQQIRFLNAYENVLKKLGEEEDKAFDQPRKKLLDKRGSIRSKGRGLKRIVIAEDTLILRQYLEAKVTKQNPTAQIISGPSGEAVLEMLQRQIDKDPSYAPDLVITDIEMLEKGKTLMTGWEFSQKVKQMFPRVMVLVESSVPYPIQAEVEGAISKYDLLFLEYVLDLYEKEYVERRDVKGASLGASPVVPVWSRKEILDIAQKNIEESPLPAYLLLPASLLGKIQMGSVVSAIRNPNIHLEILWDMAGGPAERVEYLRSLGWDALTKDRNFHSNISDQKLDSMKTLAEKVTYRYKTLEEKGISGKQVGFLKPNALQTIIPSVLSLKEGSPYPIFFLLYLIQIEGSVAHDLLNVFSFNTKGGDFIAFLDKELERLLTAHFAVQATKRAA